MTERFIPADGRPLTGYEREILDILQEECAEVIAAISKLERFGVGNTNPTTGISNNCELGLEMGDLAYMLRLVEAAHLVDPSTVSDGMLRKRDRLAVFLQNKP